MGKSLYKEDTVFTQKNIHDIPYPPEQVLENAWDEHHVENIHSSTIKSCRVVESFGDVVILIYEVYLIPKIPFFTQKFILVKSRSKKETSEYQFLSFPLKPGVSRLTLKATPSETGTKLEHTLNLKLPWYLIWLGNVLINFHNRSEEQRLAEDIQIIHQRVEAIKSGHQDDLKCIEKTSLIDVWFSGK
jgi:hypothetical protein